MLVSFIMVSAEPVPHFFLFSHFLSLRNGDFKFCSIAVPDQGEGELAQVPYFCFAFLAFCTMLLNSFRFEAHGSFHDV